MSRHEALHEIARTSLEKNLVISGGRRYVAAGAHQFRSLWTRDFAFAARGMVSCGLGDVVRDHIELLLSHCREDGALPRGLDERPVPLRVIVGSLRNRLGLGPGSFRAQKKLRPQHTDEHGSVAMDSNLLVLLIATQYADACDDEAWWQAHADTFARIYHFYRAFEDSDGLLVQPKFSDWQDSVERTGKTFYLGLLYWAAGTRLRERGLAIDELRLARLRSTLEATFFDPESGLYRGLADHDLICADGNLLAIDYGFCDGDTEAANRLYRALLQSELWSRGGIPGSVTLGRYPRSWSHAPARLVGLRNYHEDLHWSWLIALAARVARRCGDDFEADRILDTAQTMATRDGVIGEIYRQCGAELVPFRSWLYASEAPFSWGAGMFLEALTTPPR